MEKIRTKFTCNLTTDYGKHKVVSLQAVPNTDDLEYENTKFWEGTPFGHIQIHVDNLPATEMFKPGKEVYVDFIKIEE